jgi:hypothetical protein
LGREQKRTNFVMALSMMLKEEVATNWNDDENLKKNVIE